MRQVFHEELEQVSNDLVELAHLVGSAIRRSTSALLDADVQLAEQVIEGDQEIDERRNMLDSKAIDLLARAIRAGHPLTAGMKMVADETKDPIAGEFRRAHEENRFGLPFEDALLAMADRVNIVDVRILTTAILIQREVGGNLAEVLDNLANVIRVRFTIRRQLRVYTAQGRFSGYVLAVLPIAVGTAIYALNPPYITLLFTDPIGKLMVLLAVVFQIIGFLWIRKIVDIEI